MIEELKDKKIGDVIPIEWIKESVKEALLEFDAEDRIYSIKAVEYNSNLRSVGARVKSRHNYASCTIEFNPELPVEELKDTVRHEVAHIVTRAGDRDESFRIFCSINDISLHLDEEMESAEDFKYSLVCSECGSLRQYRRRGKYIKMVERSPHNSGLQCGNCGSGSFEVRYLQDQQRREAAINGRNNRSS